MTKITFLLFGKLQTASSFEMCLVEEHFPIQPVNVVRREAPQSVQEICL